MVRNSGGKNGKTVGRKHVNQVETERKLRLVGSEQELYGIVMKPLGNGRFLIMCNDQVERICIIRNKFTGRNKQSNLVSVGSWVIVGLRDWETTKENKKEKCDLLEIYSNNEKHKLLQDCKANLSFLMKQENIILNIDSVDSGDPTDDYLTFSADSNEDNSGELDVAGGGGGGGGSDNEIDFDEI